VEPDRPKRYSASIRTLRRVSGKLRALLRGSDTINSSTDVVPHLLIVDNEESIRFSMKEYFSHNGFIVDTAKEIEEAEQLITTGHYKIIIQDLRMGTAHDIDGLHIVQLAHEQSPDTRIVVLTAYGSSEVEDKAKLLGVDAFLRKPQPLSQVAQVVRGLLESPRRWASSS
jgi:DNA-binding NtrC family response regulator